MGVVTSQLPDNVMLEAIRRKCRESIEVKEHCLREQALEIAKLSRLMAGAFKSGHRLFVMGNGGSACDAQHIAVEFTHPIIEKRRPFPAYALNGDAALMTAIGNDSDFSRIYSDQLRLFGGRGDMVLAISTSGQSPNILYAVRTAREMGMVTICFSGMDGGRLAKAAEHAFVVPSFSIHRIQETHVALLHIVWDLVHLALGEEDVL